MLLLPRNVAKISEVCNSDDHHRYSFSGVHVQEFKDSWRLEATDGKKLIMLQGEKTEPRKFHDKLAAESLEALQGEFFDFIMPADDWARAFKLLNKDADFVALTGEERVIHVAADRHRFDSYALDKGFPHVADIIPRKPAVFVLDVKAIDLMAVLKAALAANDPQMSDRVRLCFYDKNAPFGVQAFPPDGQTFDALIMPLSIGNL
jgi:DNA polymerase III sliding clamp (beta) subunit (PCNA family)